MSKQDRQGVRTAADLERKYNLGRNAQGSSMNNTSNNSQNNSDQVSKIVQELSEHKINVNAKFQSVDTSIKTNQQDLKNHVENTSVHITETEKSNLDTAYKHSKMSSGNPHNVTKIDVGLGNVDNTSDADKPVSTYQKQAIDEVKLILNSHKEDVNNPHSITKSHVGLGNVDNTADASKPVSTAQQDAIDNALANANAYTDEKIAEVNVGGSGVGLKYEEEEESLVLVGVTVEPDDSEDEVHELQTEIDIVSALANANKAAHEANASAIKEIRDEVEEISGRVTVIEDWKGDLTEATSLDINGLFGIGE